MPLTVPALAPILGRLEVIVYEQERRADGGEPVGETTTYTSRTADELDAALMTEYAAACDLITTARAEPDELDAARAYLHAGLDTYAEAVAREHEVRSPKEKTLAACDVARAGAYLRTVITYPRALDALDALDDIETVAAEYVHGTDAHMDKLYRLVDAAHRIGLQFLPGAAAEPERTAIVVYLNAYATLRASAHAEQHHDTLLRIADELEAARARLLARYIESVDAARHLSGEVRRLERERP